MSNQILKVERLFPVRRQEVFQCWTSIEALKQWHCGTVSEVVMDLKVGGEFLIRFQPEPEGDCEHHVVRGKYLIVDKPSRLQYTWKWDGAEMDDSVVTVDFVEQGPESTLLKIAHEKLSDEKSRNDHGQGWNACLAGVEMHLAKTGVTGQASGTES